MILFFHQFVQKCIIFSIFFAIFDFGLVQTRAMEVVLKKVYLFNELRYQPEQPRQVHYSQPTYAELKNGMCRLPYFAMINTNVAGTNIVFMVSSNCVMRFAERYAWSSPAIMVHHVIFEKILNAESHICS